MKTLATYNYKAFADFTARTSYTKNGYEYAQIDVEIWTKQSERSRTDLLALIDDATPAAKQLLIDRFVDTIADRVKLVVRVELNNTNRSVPQQVFAYKFDVTGANTVEQLQAKLLANPEFFNHGSVDRLPADAPKTIAFHAIMNNADHVLKYTFTPEHTETGFNDGVKDLAAKQLRTLSESAKCTLLNDYFHDTNNEDDYIFINLDEVLELHELNKNLVLSIIYGDVTRANDYMKFDGYGNLYNVNVNTEFNDRFLDELVDYAIDNANEYDILLPVDICFSDINEAKQYIINNIACWESPIPFKLSDDDVIRKYADYMYRNDCGLLAAICYFEKIDLEHVLHSFSIRAADELF